MLPPTPRGPLSEAVVRALTGRSRGTGAPTPGTFGTSVMADEDFQLALWTLYQLPYQGFDGVDPDAEWDPLLLTSRRHMEERFEAELRRDAAEPVAAASREDVVDTLFALTEPSGTPDLASYLQRKASADQMRAFLRQRSIYHLRESDPHSFVLPRVGGAAKVALAELQYDEYGGGRPERLHSALFARALDAASLDPAYGAHIDEASASTLAVNNAIDLFALHRRLRGAALGHLAAFEATSSLPCRMIVRGLERLEFPAPVIDYYQEHVEADAVHEQVAIRDICGSLVADEPDLAEDVVFGAVTCLRLDDVAADQQLASWTTDPGRPRTLEPA